MSLSYNLIHQKDYQVSTWSGGKTTQICLAPQGGQYKVGEFDYRISSATIELDESTFSPLGGYSRLILSLDSPIVLQHPDRSDEVFRLQPFEVHAFEGDWQTVSRGKCTDFNLIYKSSLRGSMSVVTGNEAIQVQQDTEYVLFAVEDVELTGITEYPLTLAKGSSIQIFCSDEESVIYTKSEHNRQPLVIVSSITNTLN